MGDLSKPSPRGLALLEAHVRSLDPTALTAAERLYAKVGRDLGRKLVFALAPGGARSTHAA
jgi:hypothetical protein